MNRDNHSDNKTSTLGNILLKLYGPDAVKGQAERYSQAVRFFWSFLGKNRALMPGGGVHIFRAPGRTEIGGNHTDHQHGQVLAAAIDKDILAVAAETTDMKIRIYSEGFGWTEVDLRPWVVHPTDAGAVNASGNGDTVGASGNGDTGNASGNGDTGHASANGGADHAVAIENPNYAAELPEKGTTAALIYGMVDGMKKAGYQIGGFCAYVTSDVPGGAGLSSSAA